MQQQPLKLKKKGKKSEKTIASKKKTKVNDWLKRSVQLGHNRTLLHELKEEDIDSFKNYLSMDPDIFNNILERINPRIKKMTSGYKEPIPACLRLAVLYFDLYLAMVNVFDVNNRCTWTWLVLV